ncbi:uncharacterized protein LY89DRAFT_134141 [Mollisia scopiformis]|uniref:Uncharacterized protein n=1 Tax=Mollisia scopiformis TaxID=149040 RepID=A0A194X398_MOLSC|nr:uncharacterized protein LY89DRAFT_134141 [Mollisia scopiformis]KUJ14297.1 hypothetical protein LY89DRAFT_134141 [Mollisia scopiformis]
MAQPCASCLEQLSSPLCLNCKSTVGHCSPSCFGSNSVLHLLLCKPYWTPMRPPRPPKSTLGLYIPIFGPPSFRFVHYYCEKPGDITRPDLRHLLGTDNLVRSLLTWNTLQEKELPYTLQLIQIPGKQAINSFVSNLTHGTGYARHWGGPMVILAHEHQRYAVDTPVWRDVGCHDLRWMVDYWRLGDEPLPVRIAPVKQDESTVQGVQVADEDEEILKHNVVGVTIACEGERDRTGKKFMEAEIGVDHPIWREEPTQISVGMELPLLMYRFPVQAVDMKMNDLKLRNPEASAMSRVIDYEDPKWGQVANNTAENIGSVLVVRADRKDLDAKQVEMLATFCDKLVGDFMDVVSKNQRILKEKIKDECLDKSIFHLFFEKKRSALALEDKSWNNVESPYQV